MDDWLSGARDKVLRETFGSAEMDGVMQFILCIGALVFLGLLVMAFLLALAVKRKTDDASEGEGCISPDEAPAPSELKIAPDDPVPDTDPPVTEKPSSRPAACPEENLVTPVLVLSSGVVYFLVCAFPVMGGLEEGPWMWRNGFVALAFGIFVLPVAWIANPLYLVALVLSTKGRHGAALPFSATATIIAFVTAVFISGEAPLNGATAIMWASTMALLLVSNILDLQR